MPGRRTIHVAVKPSTILAKRSAKRKMFISVLLKTGKRNESYHKRE